VAWSIEEPSVDDAEELGLVHVQIWREAYAGLMSPESGATEIRMVRQPTSN
jgi:hypothetical protein